MHWQYRIFTAFELIEQEMMLFELIEQENDVV